MRVIGITGTNGKTTTAYLIAAILEAAGIRCGLLGTVAYRVGDETREASRTTPEAPDVQALLREMVDRGCGACAMEVSSHALSLQARRRHHLRRRRVHEPDARPSRLPRRHGRLLPRQAAAVRDAAARRAEPDQRRRSARRVARSTSAAGRSPTRINRPADITPGPLSFSLDGLVVRRAHAARHAARPFEARRPAERLQHPRRGRRPRSRSTCRSTRSNADCSALDGVPGRFQVVSGRTTKSPSSSTTRTPTTRCATCSRRRGRSRADG